MLESFYNATMVFWGPVLDVLVTKTVAFDDGIILYGFWPQNQVIAHDLGRNNHFRVASARRITCFVLRGAPLYHSFAHTVVTF